MLKLDNFSKFIIANWKLKGTPAFVDSYIKNICTNFNDNKCVIICPPNVFMSQINSDDFYIGGQDCSIYNEGAYTGEVSASMLKDNGCFFCIIGHSERRNFFNENDLNIIKKMNNCLKENIIPILCIGESLEQKQNGKTKEILTNQVEKNIPNLANKNNVIIAYEPLWAIGSGITPKIDEIVEIHTFIKNMIPKTKDYRVLYGGSVNSKNSIEILSKNSVDGILVGSASLNIEEFNKIIQS